MKNNQLIFFQYLPNYDFRWFKTFSVSIASERKQRQLAKQSIGDNLVAERGAFTFSVDNGEEIKEVPFVYSPNLMIAIAELVDKHDRCLTIRI